MREQILLFAQMATKGTFSRRILNDRLLLEMKVLLAARHNKLFDLIDRKMQQFFEGGLFYAFTANIRRKVEKRLSPEYTETFKVLTLEELEAGFVISVVPLLFAISAFCLERMIALKNFILFIFVGFFRFQKNLIYDQSVNLNLKIAMLKKIP